MKWFSLLRRRASTALKFWSADATQDTATAPATGFSVEEVKERVAKIKVPMVNEPLRMHAVIKLAPIPLPRAVRYESQVVYTLALLGTGLLFWGGFQVPVDWLLWYGMAAIIVFAGLFRIEGPLTRAEHKARSAEVKQRYEAYLQAEQTLKNVLHERFNERMAEFNAMQSEYENAKKSLAELERKQGNRFFSALANTVGAKNEAQTLIEKVDALECSMAELVAELEDFSDIHKEAIDAAMMDRHNARLAYWQARLDESVMTGEAVQQH